MQPDIVWEKAVEEGERERKQWDWLSWKTFSAVNFESTY